MFFKSNPSKLSFVETDVHAHFLPGIDDGAKTMDDTLHLLQGLMNLGYRKMIATPHIMQNHYNNTPGIVRAKLEEVRAEVARKGWDIELDAAAEYMMDEQFKELLANKELMPLFDDYVLVELGRFAPPMELHELFFKMKLQGYTPVLAHPERYLFYEDDLSGLEALRRQGICLQVNLLSLYGYYGSGVRQRAEQLVKRQWVDFLGTDLHHARQLELLHELAGSHSMYRRVRKLKLLNTAIRQA
jgi:tyrosine-protein phosphatase YwqE